MKRLEARACSFPGCEKKHEGHGLCKGHGRQRKKGESLRPLMSKSGKYPAPEDVIAAIQSRVQQGKSLMTAHVSEDDLAILNASRRCFGTYAEAVRASGFDYSSIRGKAPNLTEQCVLDRITKRKTEGKPINAAALQDDDPVLWDVARRFFGSLDAAITAAGFDPALERKDRGTEAGVGHSFEAICFLLFPTICPEWDYSRTPLRVAGRELRPDVVDRRVNEWIDFKSDVYGQSAAESRRKYLPHAASLRFIGLRNKRGSSEPGVIYESVFQYEHLATTKEQLHLFKVLHDLARSKRVPQKHKTFASKWSDAQVFAVIRDLPEEHRNYTYITRMKGAGGLRVAIDKRHGGLDALCLRLGLASNRLKSVDTSLEEKLELVRAYAAGGGEMSAAALRAHFGTGMHIALIMRFHSTSALAEAVGAVAVKRVRQPKERSRDEVAAWLKALCARVGVIYFGLVKKQPCGQMILKAVRKLFGSLEAACSELGLPFSRWVRAP